MSYLAFGSEVDLSDVHDAVFAAGGRMLVPRVEAPRIVAVELVPDEDAPVSRFGIREPTGPEVEPAAIDLVLVPGVAFDRSGRRLGYGAGYYDQFLTRVAPGPRSSAPASRSRSPIACRASHTIATSTSSSPNGGSRVDVRPATDDDGAGIAEVRDAIGGQHDDSGSDAAYRAHLMAHGRLFVAVRGGRVIGFAGARDVGGHRLLSDLFVDPQVHGGGVGRVLLATVLDGSEERYTFSSSDPRALPIYARAGMRPRWPLLYLRGPAPEVATEALEALAVEPAEADDVAAVEQAVTGVDRAVEHRYWARRPGASAAIVRIDGAAVGAVELRGAGWRNEDRAPRTRSRRSMPGRS